jgi:hypothetical protein
MEDGDQVAAASVIPDTEGNGNGANGEDQSNLPLQ